MKQEIESFKTELKLQEKKSRTIDQYVRYINEFLDIMKVESRKDITKELLIEYKAKLKEIHKDKLNSINIKVLIINKFISYLGFPGEYKLKQEKQQKQTTLENVLTEKEYNHLREFAKSTNQMQLYYLMGTLEGTGIRVSELKYITYEAVKKQEARITNKNKTRVIPIQDRVKKELLTYCKEIKVTSGIIFKTSKGKPLDNAYIWRQLQALAGKVRSGLKKSKVHAHSFRHLFAKEFINNGGSQSELADILGHESLETTRIYTTKSVAEQRETLNKMSKSRK